jgi:hypothetical protein
MVSLCRSIDPPALADPTDLVECEVVCSEKKNGETVNLTSQDSR